LNVAALTSLKFTLRSRDGRAHELVVDSARALVGSGAHCEIRLPAEEAAVEHLLVEASAAGVFAQARCLNPPVLLSGVPFTQGRILPDSVLEIGGTHLSARVAEADVERTATGNKKRARMSPVHVIGLIGFPLGILALATGPDAAHGDDGVPEPPALFAADAKVTCPQNRAAEASALALDERALAEAQSERAPFFAEDGVSAVAHYARAAACFKVGGDGAAAQLARESAAALERKLNQEFHVHQVRLERALATEEYDRARTEIHMLLSFVAAQPGEYANWLTTLDRRIQLKYSGENQER
jgi:hypothetical protein